MSLDTDLYSYISMAVFPAPVEQNTISENLIQPRVWFQRKATNQELFTDGTPALLDSQYDVEVAGLDQDAVESLADLVRIPANGYRGKMGFTTILCMTVEDMEQDYTPKLLGADEGFHVAAFRLHIVS